MKTIVLACLLLACLLLAGCSAGGHKSTLRVETDIPPGLRTAAEIGAKIQFEVSWEF